MIPPTSKKKKISIMVSNFDFGIRSSLGL
jgi:hypothetical protein